VPHIRNASATGRKLYEDCIRKSQRKCRHFGTGDEMQQNVHASGKQVSKQATVIFRGKRVDLNETKNFYERL